MDALRYSLASPGLFGTISGRTFSSPVRPASRWATPPRGEYWMSLVLNPVYGTFALATPAILGPKTFSAQDASELLKRAAAFVPTESMTPPREIALSPQPFALSDKGSDLIALVVATGFPQLVDALRRVNGVPLSVG
jgi:hypothetical protein